jgi:hypothetical protein
MPVFYSGQVITDQELNSGTGCVVDSTLYTGTPVALTQFSNLWDIGPSIAVAGSAWRLTVLGKTAMGSSQIANWYYIGYGPTGTTQQEIVQSSAANIPINQSWLWTVVIHMVVNTAGAGGSITLTGSLNAGQVPNNSSLAWTGGGGPLSFNTTIDNKLCLLLTFTAATGTPVFTTYCSIFERLS